MAKEMHAVASEVNASTEDLSIKERNLLSVAYKNISTKKRGSWRVVSNIVQREYNMGNEGLAEIALGFQRELEEEIKETSRQILDLLNKNLIPAAKPGEATVFYYKMKGDYLRYLAEIASLEDRANTADEAQEAYEMAKEEAHAKLAPTDHVRLGLALNFSVFHYEIQENMQAACKLAQEAVDDAQPLLDTLDEPTYKDAELIVHLLIDNLRLWTNSDEGEQTPETAPEDEDADEFEEVSEKERL